MIHRHKTKPWGKIIVLILIRMGSCNDIPSLATYVGYCLEIHGTVSEDAVEYDAQ